MPLGLIIDPNVNHSAVNVWAIVDSSVVVNTIEASYTDITAISASHDYCVDLTIQGQSAGIGWTYDAGSDTFAPPFIPVDWLTVVENDFDSIVDNIGQTIDDAGSSGGSLSDADLAIAYGRMIDDTGITGAELTLMNAVYAYILANK